MVKSVFKIPENCLESLFLYFESPNKLDLFRRIWLNRRGVTLKYLLPFLASGPNRRPPTEGKIFFLDAIKIG